MVIVAVVLLSMLAGAAWWALHQALPLKDERVEVAIEAGQSVKQIARAWNAAGVEVPPDVLWLWFRLSGDARRIKAGSYEIERGTTAIQLLRKMVQGDESLAVVRLIDGWSFRQFRAALAQSGDLKHDTAGLDDEALMAALGRPGVAPEGRFFPDTYAFSKGSSELRVLKRAMGAMDRHLARAWQDRMSASVLQSPDELLTLASIVEKETGREDDRPMVASVFHNRLRVGMPLQTDPTVIYGLGERFDGNLRKRDLQEDTPYNTYTRKGLPPTPIAMPGQAALAAAAAPARSKALYFVARGDGSSEFSETLEQHNRAVNRFQRGGR